MENEGQRSPLVYVYNKGKENLRDKAFDIRGNNIKNTSNPDEKHWLKMGDIKWGYKIRKTEEQSQHSRK